MTPFTNELYNHFGVLLSVSGERDTHECTVTRVTAADSDIDLFDLLSPSTIESIAYRVDAQLSAQAAAANDEARVDAYEWAAA